MDVGKVFNLTSNLSPVLPNEVPAIRMLGFFNCEVGFLIKILNCVNSAKRNFLQEPESIDALRYIWPQLCR